MLDAVAKLLKDGQPAKALALLEPELADGGSPDGWHLNGLAHHQLENYPQAVNSMIKAIEAKPQSEVYRSNLAIVYNRIGASQQAIEQYRNILKSNPNHIVAHRQLLYHLRSAREQSTAIQHGLKALALGVEDGSVHNNLGNCYNDLGEMNKAAFHYQQAVVLNPRYGQAWSNLASVTRYEVADHPHIKEMESSLALGGLSEHDRGQIYFGLGKAYKDLGQPKRAFGCYQKANASVAGRFPWDGFEAYLAANRDFFKGEWVKSLQPSRSAFRPIFIVGMLRSGTSLVEQILAAHPELAGVGERPELAKLTQPLRGYPQCLSNLSSADLEKLACGYQRSISSYHQPEHRPVDKMMTNFMHIGLIGSIFPEAKIVHVHRHPKAVGFSVFCQNFASQPGWDNSLKDIRRYYENYLSMMDHWSEHSPISIHHLRYETLLSKPESVVRGLLSYCDLEWDVQCLNFHSNLSIVQTASNWQVRQPLDAGNADRWRMFEAFLSEFNGVDERNIVLKSEKF